MIRKIAHQHDVAIIEDAAESVGAEYKGRKAGSSIVAEMNEKDKRIQYFRHPRNIGQLNNFNFGLSHVNTPFFSSVSDDDVLLPGFYQKALRCFKRHPEILFAAG